MDKHLGVGSGGQVGEFLGVGSESQWLLWGG